MKNFWKNRQVLVTGASGIVGSWLVKALLAAEAKVVALVWDIDSDSEFFRSGDHSKVTVIHGVVEDPNTFERILTRYETSVIFHLAAQAIVEYASRCPFTTFETNIRGTYNMLEACRVHSSFIERVIIASSDKAYGASSTLPYTEDMALSGRYPYDVSKTCADLLAQSYFHTYHLPVAIARCGNIYGGGDLHWSRIVPGTIRSFLENRRPEIRSDGKFIRDYLYVQDAVSAYLLLAASLDHAEVQGQAFNFGPEKPISVLEMVGLIQSLMGKKDLEPVIRNQAVHEIRNQYLSFEKAKRILNWKPAFSLEKGLAETIEWYREYFRPK